MKTLLSIQKKISVIFIGSISLTTLASAQGWDFITPSAKNEVINQQSPLFTFSANQKEVYTGTNSYTLTEAYKTSTPSLAVNSAKAFSEWISHTLSYIDKSGKMLTINCGSIRLNPEDNPQPAAYYDGLNNDWHYFSFAKDIYLPHGFLATALAYYNGDLYLGGRFQVITQSVSHVPPMPDIYYTQIISVSLLKLNALGEFEVVPNAPRGLVNTLKVIGNSLYLGGDFGVSITYPDVYSRNIARYDGKKFSALGTTVINELNHVAIQGVPLPVYAIKALPNHADNTLSIIIGTAVTEISMDAILNIEQLLDVIITDTQTCLDSNQRNPYQCQRTAAVLKKPVFGGVWQLNDQSGISEQWKNIGLSNGPVFCLDLVKDEKSGHRKLLVGGNFTKIGFPDDSLEAIQHLAVLNFDNASNAAWESLGTNPKALNGPVFHLDHIQQAAINQIPASTHIIASGAFNKAANLAVNHIAKYSYDESASSTTEIAKTKSFKTNKKECLSTYSNRTLSLELPEVNNQKVLLDIYDISGKKILSKEVRVANNYVNLELGEEAAGVYVIHADALGGKICDAKFIKTDR